MKTIKRPLFILKNKALGHQLKMWCLANGLYSELRDVFYENSLSVTKY